MLFDPRKISVIFFTSFAISPMGFLYCLKPSQANSFFVDNNGRQKFIFPWPRFNIGRALISRAIGFTYRSISVVFGNTGLPKIFYSVVSPIKIYMIYFIIRPLSIMIKPRQSVPTIKNAIYFYSSVSIGNIASGLSSKSSFSTRRTRFSIFPSKNTRFWIVVQNGSNEFGAKITSFVDLIIFYGYFFISHIVMPLRLSVRDYQTPQASGIPDNYSCLIYSNNANKMVRA